MPTKPRAKANPKKYVSNEDYSQLSQGSNGSDDSGMLQLMQKMKENAAKKQKESEAQFLKKAETGCDAIVASGRQVMQQAALQVEAVYEQALTRRASINDKIRQTWLAIQQEQERCQEIADRLEQIQQEALEKLDAGFGDPLAMQQRACEEEKHAIDQIQAKRIQS